MVYSFYFLCFGSRRNECNSLFGEKKGEKSEDCGLFWYCLRYAVNDDKMISPATIVYDKYKGDFFNIYIRWGLTPPTDIASGRAHIFRVSGNLSDLFYLSLPKTIAFIPYGAKTQKKEIIPYPRCDYRADGIWYYFFFRLFPNESNSWLILFFLLQ